MMTKTMMTVPTAIEAALLDKISREAFNVRQAGKRMAEYVGEVDQNLAEGFVPTVWTGPSEYAMKVARLQAITEIARQFPDGEDHVSLALDGRHLFTSAE